MNVYSARKRFNYAIDMLKFALRYRKAFGALCGRRASEGGE